MMTYCDSKKKRVWPQHIVVEGRNLGQKMVEKHRFLILKNRQKYR